MHNFKSYIIAEQQKAATAHMQGMMWRFGGPHATRGWTKLQKKYNAITCQLIQQAAARNAREMQGITELDQFYA